MQTYEGNLLATGLKFAIIVSRFNEFITSKLEGGALDAIRRNGGQDENIAIFRVPGSFEIPFLADKLAKSGRYDAIVCLGAVIRGATTHHVYVSSEVAKGVAQAALASGIPVAFGVLTTDSVEQAIERAGTKAGNKGFDAALSAIEMANLYRQLPGA